MAKHYYYLHSNGDIIGKNPNVVDSDPQYFDSDFVKKVWCIDTEDRSTAWKVVLEGLALGAQDKRVKELADKWGLTFEDSVKALTHGCINTSLLLKGLEIFTEKILGMSYKEYQDKIDEETKDL